ncbi:MAG TPA: hypothetical protein VNZ22_14810 [Bacillota bacterium]|nr:hypothetical protein [Bacillota bacterium]
MKHKKAVAAGVLMLGIGTVALALAGTGTAKSRSGLRRPHLDYLKAVNLAAPPEDPQLLFLLMGEYANANRPYEGAGGHGYFRSLDPAPRFYARSNYQEELRRELDAAGTFAKAFFGARFNLDEVRSFKPDVTITQATGVNVGGTRIELIPVEGGETPDALFINVPDLGVLFVGDFIMPYLGAPFVEEGNLQGLLDAIDIVVEKQPRHILHGHEPLTR